MDDKAVHPGFRVGENCFSVSVWGGNLRRQNVEHFKMSHELEATMNWYAKLLLASVLLVAATGSNRLLAQSTALPDQMNNGEALFQQYCATCHGSDARGNGPVAGDLKTTPPSLREIAKRRGGEFNAQEIAAFIDGRHMPRAHGTPEMPIWGRLFGYAAQAEGALSSDQIALEKEIKVRIALLVDYLKSIQDK
jgi:mono/diheme cytochrome c family protein